MDSPRSPEDLKEDRRLLLDPSAPPAAVGAALQRLLQEEVSSPFFSFQEGREASSAALPETLQELSKSGALTAGVRALLAQASEEKMLAATFEGLLSVLPRAEEFPEPLRDPLLSSYLAAQLHTSRHALLEPPVEALLQMGSVMTSLTEGLKTLWDAPREAQRGVLLPLLAFTSQEDASNLSWRSLVIPAQQQEEKAHLLYQATLSITHAPLFRGPLLQVLLPRLQEDPLLLPVFLLALGGGENVFMRYEGEAFPRQSVYLLFQATLLLSLWREVGDEGFLNLLKVLLQEGRPLRDREALAFLAAPAAYRGMPPSWWLPLVRSAQEG